MVHQAYFKLLLLDFVNPLVAEPLHEHNHRFKLEIVAVYFELLVRFLRDEHARSRTLRAHTRCLVHGVADERELRLCFANDAAEYVACMHANLNF